MTDITELIKTLATKRPVFHSEADFQHALAWEVHQQLPSASIRLEFPTQRQGKAFHVDIWVVQDGAILAVELKYKTRALQVPVGGELFTLKGQSAQDIGRYDFIKDIWRLEQVLSDRSGAVGYAILLTNDSAYWIPQRDIQPVDADFRLHSGRTFGGTLRWGAGASAGTMRDREAPLILRGRYTMNWEDYSRLGTPSYNVFRYLAIKVNT